MRELGLNEIGRVAISLSHPVACEPYADSRDLGGFILIDRLTTRHCRRRNDHRHPRRARNVQWHRLDVDKQARAALNRQKPAVLWFTGLSGAGKSTIANIVEKQLLALGHHTMTLDGDNVRHGLNRDLGFSEADRVENIRRIAEVAKLFVEAGLIVLVSFISPYRNERMLARDCVGGGEFLEIFVDTPVEECSPRDPKGLYQKADSRPDPQFYRGRRALRGTARSGNPLRRWKASPEELAGRGDRRDCVTVASSLETDRGRGARLHLCAGAPAAGPAAGVAGLATARVLIIGQAPGTKVHATGIPWNDPSGERLRGWLEMDREQFYDESRIAIVPMGFAIRAVWRMAATRRRGRMRAALAASFWLRCRDPADSAGRIVCADSHRLGKGAMTDRVRRFREHAAALFPAAAPVLAHHGLGTQNPWFQTEALPALRLAVSEALDGWPVG